MIEYQIDKVQIRLKKASHPCHVRINCHPLLADLISRENLQPSYCKVLVAYFHLYQKLETRVDEFLNSHSIPFDYSIRRKLSWLQDDLGFFKKDPYILSGLSLPIDFPPIETVGQLIGVLYSIEGATLGGQVIASNLRKNHNLTINQGASFFNGYAEHTAKRWEEFCQFADSIQNDEDECKSVELATILTFSKFEELLNDCH